MAIKFDLTNQRFDKWFVIEQAGSRPESGEILWKCKCDCGTIRKVRASGLRGGHSKSCGCIAKEAFKKQNVKNKLPDGEASFNALYLHYKHSASSRGLSFELTKLQFKKLTQRNCFYCDTPPHNIFKHKKKATSFVYNGIDRVNPLKGYIIDNCMSCCKTCNYMKRDYKTSEFLDKVKLIYENLKL